MGHTTRFHGLLTLSLLLGAGMLGADPPAAPHPAMLGADPAAAPRAAMLGADPPATGGAAARSARPADSPDAHQSLSAKLLDFIGIPANSGALRGSDDRLESGSVWLVEIAGGKSRQLTRTAEFRSPIFVPGGTDVLALRGSDVLRLSAESVAPRKLATVKGAAKLVGCSAKDPDKVLLLITTPAGGSELAELSVGTGALTRVPFDSASRADGELLAYLNGWDRTYPAGTLYVQRRSQETLAGVMEWQDVFFQSGNAEAVNVSRCDAVDCGQPALSPDARRVVFIMGEHR